MAKQTTKPPVMEQKQEEVTVKSLTSDILLDLNESLTNCIQARDIARRNGDGSVGRFITAEDQLRKLIKLLSPICS